MVMDDAPLSPIFSRRGEKPPAVPCPPHMGMDPVAMPKSASWLIPRAMPTEIRFCATIRRVTRPIITKSGFPPLRSAFISDWNPTDVKKIIIQRSFMPPSNRHSMPKIRKSRRVSRETISPPETGDGMQKRFKKGTYLVRVIPRSRAATPTPALA